jgi:hypothetical protein
VGTGVRGWSVGSGVAPATVGVGDERPTTTGAAPPLSPGGRTNRKTATAVPTSIVSNDARYRLNEGIALDGCRHSAQYVVLPCSSQYGLAQRLHALIAGCSQE